MASPRASGALSGSCHFIVAASPFQPSAAIQSPGMSANSSDLPPPFVRYWVVLLATVMAVLLYLDRICLSFTERYMKADLGLDDQQISWLLSAFFCTYALGQVPAGWLSDRFGARRM